MECLNNSYYENGASDGTVEPTILTTTLSSTSASVSMDFDLNEYEIEKDAANVLVYISSYNGGLRGTGGGISGYLTKSYDSSTKTLTVTRSSDDYMVSSNICEIVVIIF